MGGTTYVGFVVAATNQTTSASATFSNFDLSQGSEAGIVDPTFAAVREEPGRTDVADGLPDSPMLTHNYPNPFNPVTKIGFFVPASQHVRLGVFNVLGELVRELVNTRMEAGMHEAIFDARNLPSGVYFYRLETDSYAEIRKMTLLK